MILFAVSVRSRRHFKLVRDGKSTGRVVNMLYIENPELDWFEPDTIPSSLLSSREFSKGNRSLEFLELLACIKSFLVTHLSCGKRILARGELRVPPVT